MAVVIRFTEHAIVRFMERARPTLDRDQALRELVRLTSVGQVTASPPAWYVRDAGGTGVFLVVGDLIFPLDAHHDDPRCVYVAMTCVTPGTISDAARTTRKRYRQTQQFKRRQAKRNRSNARPLSPTQEDE